MSLKEVADTVERMLEQHAEAKFAFKQETSQFISDLEVSRRMHSDGVCAALSFSTGDGITMAKKHIAYCCQGLMRHWQSADQGTLAEIRMKL